MASRMLIDGIDGKVEACRIGDKVRVSVSDEEGLFSLTVDVGANDARALSGYLEQASFIAFDSLEVGDEDDLG